MLSGEKTLNHPRRKRKKMNKAIAKTVYIKLLETVATIQSIF